MKPRQTKLSRKTTETEVSVTLDLDGVGASEIATGLGFLDHMLTSFARHGRFDLKLSCRGDLRIDDHHSVEDCALTLGQAFDEALAERRGVARVRSSAVAAALDLTRADLATLARNSFTASFLDPAAKAASKGTKGKYH